MSSPDWDNRRLCPDGGCVGVLGDDGVCKACGKAGGPAITASAHGSPASSASSEEEDEDEYDDDDDADDTDDDEDESDDDDDNDEPDDAEPGTVQASGSGWTDRALCPDGGCIGVIGDKGTCNVCGRSAA